MRLSQVKLLIWEVWYASKWPIILVLITLPSLFALINAVFDVDKGMWNKLTFLSYACWLMYLPVIFSFSRFSEKHARYGYFQHLLLLPLSTRSLVLFPMCCIVLITVIGNIFWQSLIFHFALNTKELSIVIAAICALMIFSQASGWGSIQGTYVKIIAFLVVASASGVAAHGMIASTSLLSPILAGMLLLVILLLSIAFAFGSVNRCRHHDSSIFEDASLNPLRRRTDKTFNSAFAAHFWYERKTFGLLLPSMTLTLAILVLAAANAKGTVMAMFLLSLSLIGLFPMLALAMSGSHMGQKELGMSLFIATRPLSDTDLALVKLKMIATNVLLSAPICLLVLFISLFYIDFPPETMTKLNATIGEMGKLGFAFMVGLNTVLYLGCLWSSGANFLSLGLTQDKSVIIKGTLLAFLITVIYVAVTALAYYFEAFRMIVMFSGLVYVLIAFPLVGAGFLTAFLAIKYIKKVGFAPVKKACISTVTLAAVCLAIIWAVNIKIESKYAFSYFTLFFGLISLNPFFAAPLALSRSRHR